MGLLQPRLGCMAAADKLGEKQILRTLVPPSALNAENFEELARGALKEDILAERTTFKIGDRDNKAIYLLEGKVKLFGENSEHTVISSGSQKARHALANNQPRQVSAPVA